MVYRHYATLKTPNLLYEKLLDSILFKCAGARLLYLKISPRKGGPYSYYKGYFTPIYGYKLPNKSKIRQYNYLLLSNIID